MIILISSGICALDDDARLAPTRLVVVDYLQTVNVCRER
jgi:hypothetical protein